jgi:hypothetical protein
MKNVGVDLNNLLHFIKNSKKFVGKDIYGNLYYENSKQTPLPNLTTKLE